MVPTLASMARFLSVMNEREQLETLREETREHLVSATLLINEYLGLNPEGGSEVLLIDTYAPRRPTVGITLPISDREPFPTIDLPVGGVLTGLQVRYRGHSDSDYGDAAFDWDNVEPLNDREHYIYEPSTGRLRLLFQPQNLPHGLEIRYGNSVSSFPDLSVGETLRTQQASVFTNIDVLGHQNLNKLFSGIDHKTRAESAQLTGLRAITLSLLETAPGTFESIRLYAPRDEPAALTGFGMIVDAGNGIPVQMRGVDMTPKAAEVYSVSFTVQDAVKEATLLVQPLIDGTAVVAFSRIRIRMFHPTWRHLDGAVHPTISMACAQLADFLRRKAASDGTGKTTDQTRRSYTGRGTIPSDIAGMLSPFQRNASAVTFI